MNLIINSNPKVEEVFKGYPEQVTKQMHRLRELVLDVAGHNSAITQLEETLKWGEPSYLTKHGSTLRMDWKAKTPHQYGLYFKCTSKLIPTIREIFGDTFKYEKNRAILFLLDDEVPEKELRICISMALNYHKLKQRVNLGYSK